MMKTILLTGATGFIGKNFIDAVKQYKDEFDIVAFVDKSDDRGIEYLKKNKIKYLNIDQLDSYNGVIDFCVHLASYGVAYGARNIELMIDVNIKLAATLAEFCSNHGCELFINTGSCFEYGSCLKEPIKENQKLAPEDIYAASKVSCEVFLRTYLKIIGLRSITIRPFAVFGKYEPQFRILPLIFDAGKNKKAIDLTGGEQIRDYMCASDVANSIIQLIVNRHKLFEYEAINICSGQGTSLKDFIMFVADACNFDKSLFKFGSKPYRENESMYFVGNNERLIEVIGNYDFSLSKEKIIEVYDEWHNLIVSN